LGPSDSGSSGLRFSPGSSTLFISHIKFIADKGLYIQTANRYIRYIHITDFAVRNFRANQRTMRSGRDPKSTSLKVALLAVWLLLHAFGSGGLHTILECGHDEAAETFAHQETETAHWAGLKSAQTIGSECDACTIDSQVALRPLEVVSVRADSGSEWIGVDLLTHKLGIGWSSARPRAPPLS
jgi:hypothetical protein